MGKIAAEPAVVVRAALVVLLVQVRGRVLLLEDVGETVEDIIPDDKTLSVPIPDPPPTPDPVSTELPLPPQPFSQLPLPVSDNMPVLVSQYSPPHPGKQTHPPVLPWHRP